MRVAAQYVIELVFDVPEGSEVDQGRMETVILNSVTNARYMGILKAAAGCPVEITSVQFETCFPAGPEADTTKI